MFVLKVDPLAHLRSNSSARLVHKPDYDHGYKSGVENSLKVCKEDQLRSEFSWIKLAVLQNDLKLVRSMGNMVGQSLENRTASQSFTCREVEQRSSQITEVRAIALKSLQAEPLIYRQVPRSESNTVHRSILIKPN